MACVPSDPAACLARGWLDGSTLTDCCCLARNPPPALQERHPMKPHRLTLTNALVVGYGLHKRMDVFSPREATQDELESFHDADYVDFLSRCVVPALPPAAGWPSAHPALPSPALAPTESRRRPRRRCRHSSSSSTLATTAPSSAACTTSASSTPARRSRPRASSRTAAPTLPSTGRAACTTPRRARPAASATSTTLCWRSSSC